jgi:hypothetical protein
MDIGSTFDTKEPQLKHLLERIETGKTQLPDFQRGWVWDDNHIRSLIASVSLSYPIGAVMMLEAGGDGVKFKPRPVESVIVDEHDSLEELILDGQQRLTSLYLSTKNKNPVNTTTEKHQKIDRFYYLDMEMCLNPLEDRFDAIISIPADRKIKSDFGRKIELDLSDLKNEFENKMFPLNTIFDLTQYYEWTNKFREHYQHSAEISKFLSEFEQKIFLPFQEYKVPVIKLTKETPKEAVCQVFENVNTGGVSLTVFELLTATFASDGFELRKDWEKKQDQLMKHDVLKSIDESSFLTAITLLTSYKKSLSVKSAVSCKRKDVLNLTLEDYKENAPNIVEGYIKAAKLLNREKIFSSKDLPYNTQLVPLSAICSFLGKQFEEDSIKRKLIKWFWCGVLGELYGGANETRYALDISGVLQWIQNESSQPNTIRDASFSPVRLLTLQTRLSAAYKGIMALLMKEGANDFISGDEIELTTYFGDSIDIHHIFPKKYCIDRNYKKDKWNSIINKAPLSYRTNRIIGGNKPSLYLNKIKTKNKIKNGILDGYLESHLIDPMQLRNDRFEKFVIERAKRIISVVEHAMGKAVVGKDSEETVNAFGSRLD